MRYYLCNGFHGTRTYLNIKGENGEIIQGNRLRRAERRLCPYHDCTCGSSSASRANEYTGEEGIKGRPEIQLQWCYDCTRGEEFGQIVYGPRM